MIVFFEKHSRLVGVVAGLFLAIGLFIVTQSITDDAPATLENTFNTPARFDNADLNVDFSKTSVEIDQILNGGPGKDGIPALVNPRFEPQSSSRVPNETQVIYVESNGVERLYPYNILVWHEIVNDVVGGIPLVITFCPLCGSAIVYESTINDEVIEFGVSGYLFESNMIMYSREKSETLWSQSLGKAIVGDRLDQELEHHPFQLISYGEAMSLYPNAEVLSGDTGHSRNYDGNPYSGYEVSEELLFPVSVKDVRFPAKELFYIVPLEGMSVAVRQNKTDGTYKVPDTNIEVTFDRGTVTARWGDAVMPGYYEMWFSWATYHQDNGIVF